jgi:hypothetical protein
MGRDIKEYLRILKPRRETCDICKMKIIQVFTDKLYFLKITADDVDGDYIYCDRDIIIIISYGKLVLIFYYNIEVSHTEYHVLNAEQLKTAVSSNFHRSTTVGTQIVMEYRPLPVNTTLTGGRVRNRYHKLSEILRV